MKRAKAKRLELENLRKDNVAFLLIKNDVRQAVKKYREEKAKKLEILHLKQKNYLQLLVCQNMFAGFGVIISVKLLPHDLVLMMLEI